MSTYVPGDERDEWDRPPRPPASRNLIAEEVAEYNRTEREGGHTFNAFVPRDYEGAIFVVAALRIGEHAHVEVSSGRQIVQPNEEPRDHRSVAGRLILRWDDWLMLRGLLEMVPWTRIAEVERPTPGQLERHTTSENAVLAHAREVADAQAEDEALWADALSVVEAYAQQELRTLTRAVEGDVSAIAAVDDP